MKSFIITGALIVATYVVLGSAIAVTHVIGVVLQRPVKPKKRKNKRR